jgi:predicted transcriptional regulator
METEKAKKTKPAKVRLTGNRDERVKKLAIDLSKERGVVVSVTGLVNEWAEEKLSEHGI